MWRGVGSGFFHHLPPTTHHRISYRGRLDAAGRRQAGPAKQ